MIGPPLVAEPVVIAVLEPDVDVAESPVERLGLRRLGELADIRLRGPVLVELIARDQPRIERRAIDAVEDVRVGAQARDQPQPRGDVDPEVGVETGAEQLRAALQLGRRDVGALIADQRVVDRDQCLVARDA
jgi:hypothetical protein